MAELPANTARGEASENSGMAEPPLISGMAKLPANSDRAKALANAGRAKAIIVNMIIITAFITTTLAFIIINPRASFAHKVNIYAYRDGDTIHAEGYFNDGKPCQKSLIQVFDSNGQEILKGYTNDKGIYSFNLPKRGNLRIVMNASMGHKAEYVLEKEAPAGAVDRTEAVESIGTETGGETSEAVKHADKSVKTSGQAVDVKHAEETVKSTGRAVKTKDDTIKIAGRAVKTINDTNKSADQAVKTINEAINKLIDELD
ncbi:MAG: hypothetical protein L0Y62_02455, partial [Nitrospirae bacterium]|nr:hypothetical protein [Nitrospirota bacterium]